MKIEMRSNLQPNPLNEAEMNFLAKVLKIAAKGEGTSNNAKVTVFFTDDTTIQKYNKKFRKLDKATDVLSFPMLEQGENFAFHDLPSVFEFPLGDIIISLERCADQAVEYKHCFRRELCFLALHGLLHLLGYDHIDSKDAEVMEETAEKYLTIMGVSR